MKKVLLLLLVLSLFFISCSQFERNEDFIVKIEKNPTEDFVILNLTDIQLGNVEYVLTSEENFEMIDKLVSSVKPDLITFTGDFSYGCESAFYGICSFLNSFGIPWAPVFGNHDYDNSDITVEDEKRILMNFDNCIYRNGPGGNYAIEIVQNNKTIRSLLFLDKPEETVSSSLLSWYCTYTDSLSDIPTALFMHVPCEGFYNSEDELTKTIYSQLSTDLCVAGHWHNMNAIRKFNGVTYVHSLKTGTGYSYDPDRIGGTKITVTTDGSFSVEHVYSTI